MLHAVAKATGESVGSWAFPNSPKFKSPLTCGPTHLVHSSAHVKAFTHFAPALADTFIAVVDDFAAAGVSDATANAFGQMGFIVHYGEILASGTPVNAPGAAWHNAIYVAVVQKPPAAVGSTSY